MEVLDFFLQSIFVGYAFFVLAITLPFFQREGIKQKISLLTKIACTWVGIASVVFFIQWVFYFYNTYPQEEDLYVLKTRMFGPYWVYYWMYPFVYAILPFLLWFQFARRLKLFQVAVALSLLFVVYFERIVIMITSFHRDYVPSSWTTIRPYFLLDIPIYFFVFTILLLLGYILSRVVTRVRR